MRALISASLLAHHSLTGMFLNVLWKSCGKLLRPRAAEVQNVSTSLTQEYNRGFRPSNVLCVLRQIFRRCLTVWNETNVHTWTSALDYKQWIQRMRVWWRTWGWKSCAQVLGNSQSGGWTGQTLQAGRSQIGLDVLWALMTWGRRICVLWSTGRILQYTRARLCTGLGLRGWRWPFPCL